MIKIQQKPAKRIKQIQQQQMDEVCLNIYILKHIEEKIQYEQHILILGLADWWPGGTLMQNLVVLCEMLQNLFAEASGENSPRGGVRSPWPWFWLKTSKGTRNLPVRGSTVSHRHAAGCNDLCVVSVKRSEDGLALSQLHNDLYETWQWDQQWP